MSTKSKQLLAIQRRKPLTANVGVLGVGHHTYWPQFDGLYEELRGKMAHLVRKLEGVVEGNTHVRMMLDELRKSILDGFGELHSTIPVNGRGY